MRVLLQRVRQASVSVAGEMKGSIGPGYLVLVSFGVTGVFIAQLGALYAYKWYTFALSAAFLGYGFYKAYKPVDAEACADGTCARPIDRRIMRATLWAASAIVAVAMIFPYITPFILKF